MKTLTATALGLIALACLPASAANWSDTFVGYRTSSQYREPAILGTQEKSILTLSHASGWDYGSNFFNVDMLMSTATDPAVGSGQKTGANEVYVTYRTALNLGKVFKTNLGFGPVRDISITAGADFNAKDTGFGSKKRFLVFGPTLNFAVKNGFFDLGIWASHEQNWNGVIAKTANFDTTYLVSAAWSKKFNLGPVPMDFKGFANYVGPKGKDAAGVETVAETLAELNLLADISSIFGRKNGAVFIGPGYQYWNNKFGGANYTASETPFPDRFKNNVKVTALQAVLQIHF
jgi:nucleoside-specific outer membrane channel protein Tsx